ncbi:MAG: hypothetical protein IPO27_02555 [Bacteroidetes bacterium]|nr:hypothetical protein [Bacteroidota bacterium]
MEKAANKKPALLLLSLVIGFVVIVLLFPSIFSPFIKKLGTWFPALFGSLVSLRFISLVGVLYLKKWGPLMYLIVFAVYELACIITDSFGYFEFFTSAFIGVVFLFYYPRMSGNL